MKHPLVNPSLTPLGFTFPARQERLDYVPKKHMSINAERVLMEFWQRRNCEKSTRQIPAEVILHEILPAQAKGNCITDGDFSFKSRPYLNRDILVLSSALQWFGSSVGHNFLTSDISKEKGYHREREFLMKFAAGSKRWDMVVNVTHECNDRCGSDTARHMFDPHYYRVSDVSDRDRAVVDGLMRWLGRSDGRKFIAEYLKIRDKKIKQQQEVDGPLLAKIA